MNAPAPSPSDTTGEDERWWRNSVIYQVYIRSFADGDGDGTGDIVGLRSRLGYLAELGVDAIWINPWYLSPLNDGGYDVADYRQIDPRFGSVADAEALLREAAEHGIRVIVDLVPNHTSTEHAWFAEALAAAPGDPARDRYHFHPGTGPDGSEPPSNWLSVFGGPAWTRLPDGDWYLHLFDPSQPDMNWENPEVRAEFVSILRFWLDRGVDGFRIDVAHGLVKDMSYPDVEGSIQLLEGQKVKNHPHWDRDGVHDIIREWRSVLNEYDKRMMVAEAWVHGDRLPLYLRDDEYHQSFNFELLEADWDATVFADIIEASADAAATVGATSTWVLSNHDVMRHATRYGLPSDVDWRKWPLHGPHDLLDEHLGQRRARAAALITLALPGATYVYQGEELGLPEVWDLPTEVLDDPVWERSGHRMKGRDGCRVPLPWASDGPSYGYGAGPAWLPQPARFAPLAAEAQQHDAGSMLRLYQDALRLRTQYLKADEAITMEDLGASTLAFRRGNGIRCVVNMGAIPVAMPSGEALLASGPLEQGQLPSDTAVWLAPGS